MLDLILGSNSASHPLIQALGPMGVIIITVGSIAASVWSVICAPRDVLRAIGEEKEHARRIRKGRRKEAHELALALHKARGKEHELLPMLRDTGELAEAALVIRELARLL